MRLSEKSVFYRPYEHGSYVLIGFFIIFALLWILSTLSIWHREGIAELRDGTGSFTGFFGYFCFSISLLLSSRVKFLERLIGGLDRIYRIHRFVGILGFSFILLHPVIYAAKRLPEIGRFLLFFLPIHHRFSINLGSFAFLLMVVILVITLLKLLPYDKWKITHKFMSVVFMLATFHFLLMNKLFGSLSLLFFPMAIGFLSIFYKQLWREYFISYPEYKVKEKKLANYNTLELILEPMRGDDRIHFTPGQYAFFSFQGPGLSRESHPFTLCGSPDGSKITIFVKARGDYTRMLFDKIAPGYKAFLEGSYGRFDFNTWGFRQVWIAGGIGIAPFLNWVHLNNSSFKERKIDLFYCVHSEKDAFCLDDFLKMEKENPNFRFFLFNSEKKQRISADQILQKTGELQKSGILMCGPKRMTRDLLKQFLNLRIKRKDILFEDFEFL